MEILIGLVVWIHDFISINKYGYFNDRIKDPKTGKDTKEKIDDYLIK